MEHWKPIDGYDNYEVSSCGRVRSVKTDRILKLRNNKGYMEITLQGRTYLVHRLVAEAFISNPNNLPCVDHLNGDKTNNNISNLKWCSYRENMNNPITRDKLSKAHMGKPSSRKGVKLSEETRAKMSESHKKKVKE